ncbi:hypothetical protein [Dyadobacter sp. 3J3]|uniref:hypothetical protein n=1 Tax=Dyadobacter sp. 3J3 TaxID=2606600 RepID=UPI00135A6F8E|nr:hypothetical protein [Dyadobacter sp. 3J3]
MKELTPEQIWLFKDYFTDIHKDGHEIKPMPDNVKLTVWCDNGGDEAGYLYDVTTNEMGLEALIAQSWIPHKKLIELAREKFYTSFI